MLTVQVTAVGMGFFSKYLMSIPLVDVLLPIMVEAFHVVLTHTAFPNIGFLEFVDFFGGRFKPALEMYGLTR